MVSLASGSFVTGTLLALSGGGGLVTFAAGSKLAPIGIVLDATTAYVDLGGRFLTDGSTLEFDASGNIRIKSGAALTLGNTDINGTLEVSGLTTLSGALTVNANVDINGTLKVSGATTLSGALRVDANTDLNGTLQVSGVATFADNATFVNPAVFQADTTYELFRNGSVTAGVTASTTQSQGQGPITAEITEVSTVANVNDTVTAPGAVTGRLFRVFNNGANTLQIFPKSGDDLGSGVDTAVTLAAGSNVTFVAFDATNWESV